jgi:hypothetical protein
MAACADAIAVVSAQDAGNTDAHNLHARTFHDFA